MSEVSEWMGGLVGQSISQSVGRSVSQSVSRKFEEFCSIFLECVRIDMKAYLGSAISNQY